MIATFVSALFLLQQPACIDLPRRTVAIDARGQRWYVDGEKVALFGKTYGKYGLPRVLAPGEVKYRALHRNAVVAAEKATGTPEVIYVLTSRAGCEFQPYAAGM